MDTVNLSTCPLSSQWKAILLASFKIVFVTLSIDFH